MLEAKGCIIPGVPHNGQEEAFSETIYRRAIAQFSSYQLPSQSCFMLLHLDKFVSLLAIFSVF